MRVPQLYRRGKLITRQSRTTYHSESLSPMFESFAWGFTYLLHNIMTTSCWHIICHASTQSPGVPKTMHLLHNIFLNVIYYFRFAIVVLFLSIEFQIGIILPYGSQKVQFIWQNKNGKLVEIDWNDAGSTFSLYVRQRWSYTVLSPSKPPRTFTLWGLISDSSKKTIIRFLF